MSKRKLIYADEARRAILQEDPKLAYCIERIKAVDAVEVVHGGWLPMYKVDWIYGKEWLTDYICTECGQNHKKKSNYCPNCGAKMDGDVDG
jgi:rubrerythrin